MTLVVKQLRDFAFGAALAILIATIAFVAVRNKELAANQIERAERGIEAVAQDRTPLDVHAVMVGPAEPSTTHTFLRRRTVRDAGTLRPLTVGGSVNDKLFYDAANRIERLTSDRTPGEVKRLQDGRVRVKVRPGDREPAAFAELLPDGTGRAIAAMPIDGDRIAIAVTPPAHPAPFPLLVFIGLLGLGATLSAAGGLVDPGARSESGRLHFRGRARFAGTFAGIATLAIPCVLWGAPVASTAIVLLAAVFACMQVVSLTDRFASGIRVHRTAMAFLAPAAISMFILVAAPFIIGLVLGFYDHHHGEWSFVGLDNFGEILSGGGRPLDDPLNFWFILGVTVLWTVANVALHVTIGVALALVLSRRWLRGRGIFRMLLILPWAIPNYITALIWKGMFDGEYGAINSLFHELGLAGVSWFTSWASSFAANVATNTWLGFPFMMVVALGALETIPRELYEAASVDGASAWQRFRHITLPHLRPALGPAVALGSIWTFNMFNVIFLVSGGAPGGSTNILVTDAYRWAFERGNRYGMAAAYATIIFLILLLWTVFGTRIVRRREDA